MFPPKTQVAQSFPLAYMKEGGGGGREGTHGRTLTKAKFSSTAGLPQLFSYPWCFAPELHY